MDEFQKEIFISGLEDIINSSDVFREHIRDELIYQHTDILEEYLYKLSPRAQMYVLKTLSEYDPTVLTKPFWHKYIRKSIDKILLSCQNTPLLLSQLVLLAKIKETIDSVDWFLILERVSLACSQIPHAYRHSYENRTIQQAFEIVFNKAFSQDSENLKKLLYKPDIRGYPTHLRLKLYLMVIERGELDYKIVRRIRSESSGSLSKQVLLNLFQHRDKYTEQDFQNLIIQFADTNHKWVAQFIAFNVPKKLTPFLVGLKEPRAVQILEARMNKYEEERDGK